ncbi:helix-turn-helix domain-containing protein [Streptomyces olivochromogenes]|uniref:helix-turn-helix domain-containing protein n=1 Tax=Streptomyces olivochromogenes TaxID=1963 RepID=UPI001F43B47B|nr:DUF5937 family protein [Streptomyces olivochromogenes]MCF3131724.1 winged helix-turn-helix transcriptional regulator [Streptomyces olivochromogenes]
MLRLHFTRDDLVRASVAPGPDVLWELVLGATLLGGHQGRAVFDPWRQQALSSLRRLPAWQPRLLRSLAPPRGDFPDFLTPGMAESDLDSGLDMVLSTPRRTLRTDMRVLGRLPSWAGEIATGDGEALSALGAALRACHQSLIAPVWPRIRAHVEADRALRARSLLKGGPEGLLAGFGPTLRWKSPVLEADYPVTRDIFLDGRGLLLIPSVFCWRTPVTLIDPSLPPVLVYPIGRGPGWWAGAGQQDGAARRDGLEALLGRTRAAALRAVEDGCTTGELARRLGISAPTASEHACVLREAGLIGSLRHRNTVLHALTPLGAALLSENPRRPDRGAVRPVGRGGQPVDDVITR